MFISGGNHHNRSRFCKLELGPTQNFKMVLEPPPRFFGLPAIRFLLSGHPQLYSRTKLKVVLKGCVRVPHTRTRHPECGPSGPITDGLPDLG
jgi:hypothetical protein